MTEPLEEVEDMLPTSKAADVASNAAAKIFAAAEEDGGGMGFGSPAAATPEAKSTTSKLLDFDLAAKTKGAAASPSTPITTPAPLMEQAPSRAEDKDSVDYVKFTKDTLLWTNTVRSAFYLVSGTVLLLTVDYMLGHNVPFLVVVAYLTLAQMALNFLRQAVSPSLQQKATWLDSAWTAAAISQLAGSIKTLAAIHDEHLSASNPHKHLIIASSLWMLSLLSKVISPMHLALVLYIGAFAIPKAYVTFKAKIDPVATKAWKQAKSKFDAADHRIKAGVIMVLILLLGCISTIDLLIACFVAFVFVHSQLPKEMEEIGKRVGPVVTPLGNTATKMGTKFSDMIIGASNKFELTPTPLKKKKEQ